MHFPKVTPYIFTDMESFKRHATHLIQNGASSILVSFRYFVDFDGIRTQLVWGGIDHEAIGEALTINIKIPR